MSFLQINETLLRGFGLTCLIFIITLAVAIPLGLILSFGIMSKISPLRKILNVFIWIIRGIPLMLQIFMVYYLPGILNNGVSFWGDVDKYFYFNYGIENGGALLAVLISFIINYACYFAVIFRGGIQSVSRGQTEAGMVLGLTKKQIFRKVILFQVIKKITPPMSNEIITLVKDTALANAIGIVETIRAAQNFASGFPPVIWPIFYSGVFYLLFVGVLTVLFNFLEKKLSFYKE
ncbi:MAG: amino acid ABC transporter permease [Clostridia bacterium]|nr:amino acid ABC transporter permease [Clostridia bacterium]